MIHVRDFHCAGSRMETRIDARDCLEGLAQEMQWMSHETSRTCRILRRFHEDFLAPQFTHQGPKKRAELVVPSDADAAWQSLATCIHGPFGAMESLDVMVTEHGVLPWLEGVDSGVDPYGASSAIDELWWMNDG